MPYAFHIGLVFTDIASYMGSSRELRCELLCSQFHRWRKVYMNGIRYMYYAQVLSRSVFFLGIEAGGPAALW